MPSWEEAPGYIQNPLERLYFLSGLVWEHLTQQEVESLADEKFVWNILISLLSLQHDLG